MDFELREASPGYVVLTCRGGLSWDDRELLVASVDQYLVGRHSLRGLTLDMAGVEYVNSAGLGALFQLIRRVREGGGQIAFANIPPTIVRLFSTVGMERLARFANDVPDALSLLAEAGEPGESTAEETASS